MKHLFSDFGKVFFAVVFVLALVCFGNVSQAQSISGTVINQSSWANSTNVSPPHWYVSGSFASSDDGEGQAMLSLSWFGTLITTANINPTNAFPTNAPLPFADGATYPYTVGGGLSSMGFGLRAWIDGNNNGVYDLGEPTGTNYVTIVGTNSANNIRVYIRDDNDSDSMEDWWEAYWFGGTNEHSYGDYDNDGLTNFEEYNHTMSNYPNASYLDIRPDHWDTDGDGMDDAWEVFYGLDPSDDGSGVVDNGAVGDVDSDGLNNLFEYHGPGADGVGWRQDINNDGIAEYTISTDSMNPFSDDSDDDGAPDFEEVIDDLTHPVHPMSSTNLYPRSLKMGGALAGGIDLNDPEGDVAAFTSADGGTIEFWIYPEGDGDGTLIEFTNVVGSANNFRVSLVNYMPRVELMSGISTVLKTVGGDPADIGQLPSNQWSHIAVVFSPQDNTANIYVNNLLLAQENFISRSYSLTPPTIIRGFADGYIDEFRIWNYARIAEDLEYWASKIYPAPGYVLQTTKMLTGEERDNYIYGEKHPLRAYYRFDDAGAGIENFAFINSPLYPQKTGFNHSITNPLVVAAVSTNEAVVVSGSDDADADGLPEWWAQLHNIEQYPEYYTSRRGPLRIGCLDGSDRLLDFEYFRSFVAYSSIGNGVSWFDTQYGEEKGAVTKMIFYEGVHSCYTKYIYLQSQPVDCELNLFTPGMGSTILYINGEKVTPSGSHTNVAQSYEAAGYLKIGRNMIYVRCTSSYYDDVYAFPPVDESVYFVYDPALRFLIDCNNNSYRFKKAIGKFDANLVCNGEEKIVRGDASQTEPRRGDPRSVWHCQMWSTGSETYDNEQVFPRPDLETRTLPPTYNEDYGVPFDRDGDNLDAFYEFICGTNPREKDSDGEGFTDDAEDFDSDGLINRLEQSYGSDPWLPDTDDDGILDGLDSGVNGHPAQSLSPQKNYSATFGGTANDYLEFPNNGRFALSTWSIEGWVRPDASEADGGIIIKREVTTNAVNYELGLGDGSVAPLNVPYVRFVSGSGYEGMITSSVPIVADGATWTHLAATYYQNSLKLYTNGYVAGSGSFGSSPAFTGGGPLVQQIGIGFDGSIDELRMWSEERESFEILANINEVLTGLEDELVAYWRFDDGTSYTNSVGTSANNGTNGTNLEVQWTWGQVEDYVLQYSSDWQTRWANAASIRGNVAFSTNFAVVGPPRLQVYIEPNEAVADGGKWSYNGGASWNESGYTETHLSAGIYPITLSTVEGWIKPSSVSATLVRGQLTILTNTYTKTATLTVIVDNNAPIPAYAQWTADGALNWYGSGYKLENLTPGGSGYDILFSDISANVPGFYPPSAVHVDLLEGEDRTISVQYQPILGRVQVTFLPSNVVGSATWTISGSAGSHVSGETVTNLNYGLHTFQYSDVAGYQTPTDSSATLVDENLFTTTAVYTLLPQATSVSVDLYPAQAVTDGAQWRFGSSPWMNSGALVVTNSGNYTLYFKEVADWLEPSATIISVASEQQTTVDGTYYRLALLGNSGTGVGEFRNPRGIASSTRYIYVSDTDNHRIQVLDRLSDKWFILGGYGVAAGQFNQPFGLSIDSSNNLWVADTGNHRIQKLSNVSGQWTSYGSLGSSVGAMNGPFDLDVDSAGNVYVADHYNHRVQRMTSGGTWSEIIQSGAAAGHVRFPGGIAVDSSGYVYVADYDPSSVTNEISRVQKFAPSGVFEESVGSSSSDEGNLSRPMGLSFGTNGSMYVADYGNNRLMERGPSGIWSLIIDSSALSGPRDVTADAWGSVYISDTGNNRILKLPADDADTDKLPDAAEALYATSYTNSDTDADGFEDGYEALVGSDPANPADFPGDAFNDFNGDMVSDLSVYFPSGGSWYTRTLSGSLLAFGINWGYDGCEPVSGDFNGDGTTDFAVYNETVGVWHVYLAQSQTPMKIFNRYWGFSGAEPVVGDYNGDGIDDLAVYSAAAGSWYIRELSDETFWIWDYKWGFAGTVPVRGDYDGDGIDDLALFDNASGNWYIREVSGSVLAWASSWGWPGAIPVPGDYNGDGIADLAVYDNATGAWYIREVSGSVLAWAFPWGWSGAVPVPGDYDGDGIDDIAVFDSNTGNWYIRRVSGSVIAWGVNWGWSETDPVEGAE